MIYTNVLKLVTPKRLKKPLRGLGRITALTNRRVPAGTHGGVRGQVAN